jgi:hypothetical protein
MTTRQLTIGADEPAPDLSRLTLARLRQSAADQLGVELSTRTITAAWREGLQGLQVLAEDRGWDLTYRCANCSSPVAREMRACWACSTVFDPPADEEIETQELRLIAQDLELADIDLLDREQLIQAIEEEERRRRKMRDPRHVETVCRRLVEHVRGEMPEGWSEQANGTGVSFSDAEGQLRIFVPRRSLLIRFAVDDGSLDDQPGLVFYDDAERKRRHFGRSSYRYEGSDVTQAAAAIERAIEVVVVG